MRKIEQDRIIEHEHCQHPCSLRGCDTMATVVLTIYTTDGAKVVASCKEHLDHLGDTVKKMAEIP